jgi:hypothetical protein
MGAPRSIPGALAGRDMVYLQPVVRPPVTQRRAAPQKKLAVTSLVIFVPYPAALHAASVTSYSSPTGGIPVVVPVVNVPTIRRTPGLAG